MSARMAKETQQFLMGADGSLGYESAGEQVTVASASVDPNTRKSEKITTGSRDELADLGMDQVRSRSAGGVACDWL